MRTSTEIGFDAPMRVISPYSTARSSRSCAGIDKVAELVEEQGAAVGFLEPAVARLGRAGEAARLVAEQLGLDQIFGQRRAVHDDQRARPARRQVVEPLGDQLLAGAALADDQHRAVERRGTARPLDRVEEGEALPDELICAPCFSIRIWPTVGGKSHQLARIFTRFRDAKIAIFRELRHFHETGTALEW